MTIVDYRDAGAARVGRARVRDRAADRSRASSARPATTAPRRRPIAGLFIGGMRHPAVRARQGDDDPRPRARVPGRRGSRATRRARSRCGSACSRPDRPDRDPARPRHRRAARAASCSRVGFLAMPNVWPMVHITLAGLLAIPDPVGDDARLPEEPDPRRSSTASRDRAATKLTAGTRQQSVFAVGSGKIWGKGFLERHAEPVQLRARALDRLPVLGVGRGVGLRRLGVPARDLRLPAALDPSTSRCRRAIASAR